MRRVKTLARGIVARSLRLHRGRDSLHGSRCLVKIALVRVHHAACCGVDHHGHNGHMGLGHCIAQRILGGKCQRIGSNRRLAGHHIDKTTEVFYVLTILCTFVLIRTTHQYILEDILAVVALLTVGSILQERSQQVVVETVAGIATIVVELTPALGIARHTVGDQNEDHLIASSLCAFHLCGRLHRRIVGVPFTRNGHTQDGLLPHGALEVLGHIAHATGRSIERIDDLTIAVDHAARSTFRATITPVDVGIVGRVHRVRGVELMDGNTDEAIAVEVAQHLHTNQSSRTPSTGRTREFLDNHLAIISSTVGSTLLSAHAHYQEERGCQK